MKRIEANICKKDRIQYRKDLSARRKILRAAEFPQIILTKPLFLILRPWNFGMLRVLDREIDQTLPYTEIVKKYSGIKVSNKKLIRIYNKSAGYHRLAEKKYTEKQKSC